MASDHHSRTTGILDCPCYFLGIEGQAFSCTPNTVLNIAPLKNYFFVMLKISHGLFCFILFLCFVIEILQQCVIISS